MAAGLLDERSGLKFTENQSQNDVGDKPEP